MNRLGGQTPLPVEIVPFGWQVVCERQAGIGCAPRLRLAGEQPFTTDGGNYIADRTFADIPVFRSWLRLDMASMIVIGRPTGVEVIARQQMPAITSAGGN